MTTLECEGFRELAQSPKRVGAKDFWRDERGNLWVTVEISVEEIHTDILDVVQRYVKNVLMTNKIEHNRLHITADIKGSELWND